jgi:3-hydroxyacyl-[acyl-carrier-protein] dehydratase
MRFLLIDKIRTIVPGENATGVKCWSLDNEIFQDHFPGFPTVPGVLLTESMAQLAGILVEHSYYKEYTKANKVYPLLSIILKAKFRSFVKPGDQCIIKAELVTVDHGRANVKVTTFVDDEIKAEATLSFIIAMESDMGVNPFLHKREEYLFNIMPNDWKHE